MFQSSTGLPHLLTPQAYCDPANFQKEINDVLRSAWHLVGTIAQLKQAGDFLTAQVLGEELHIRNFDGTLKVLSNVCAHRHCLITDARAGNSLTMRCQYHGWEYGEDGFTRKIPCAKDFAPIDRNQLKLPEYRVDSVGQLVFVCLDPDAPNLDAFLGPMAAMVRDHFGDEWRKFYNGDFEYAANWKIAIENSLEAYHVESIHPQTFRNAPGEQRSEHQLGDQHTAFITDMPFAAHSPGDRFFQRSEASIVRFLGKTPLAKYQQHHVFPNLLFSFTDAISLIHSVIPLAATQSRSLMFQFGLFPQKLAFWKRWLAFGMGKLESVILNRIMQEDIQLYPKIQRGMLASPHRGTLARSEERIHSFQKFMLQSMREKAVHDVEAFETKEKFS